MSTTISTYADCVSALRESLGHLELSVSVLSAGVADFPRLASVLKTVRHYELIPQPALAAAEAGLRDEIAPSVALLLDRAEAQLDRRARRIETFRARAELQQGRLSTSATTTGNRKGRGKEQGQKKEGGMGGREGDEEDGGEEAPGTGRALSGEARLRALAVRRRREAARYGVERLELEVLQKERELRKQLEGQ